MRQIMIVGGAPRIVERQQAEAMHLAFHQGAQLGDQDAAIAAFVEIGNQQEDRLFRLYDLLRAVGDGFGNVGAAAKLRAKENVYRVLKLVGHVDDLGIEEDQIRAQDRKRGEDGGHDGAIDDRACHAAALIDADDDLPLAELFLVGPEVKAIRDDALHLLVVVFEIARDGALPVNIAIHRQGTVVIAADGAKDGLANFVFELLLDLLGNFAHDLPRGLFGLIGNHALERDDGGDQINILFQQRQRLRLKEQLVEALALDGVFLDHGYHILREVAADVAQPARDIDPGAFQTGAALLVDHLQRAIHAKGVGVGHGVGQAAEVHCRAGAGAFWPTPGAALALLGALAEDQPPAQ